MKLPWKLLLNVIFSSSLLFMISALKADAPAPNSGAKFRIKALSMRRFGEYVRLARAKHALAVYGSCFSGTIFTTRRSKPPAAGKTRVLRGGSFSTGALELRSAFRREYRPSFSFHDLGFRVARDF